MGALLFTRSSGDTEISFSVVANGADSASICGLVIGAGTISGSE